MKKEEEEKIAGMKDKIKELSAELLFLTETISIIQEQLKDDDMVLLKVRTVEATSISKSVFQKNKKKVHINSIFLYFPEF